MKIKKEKLKKLIKKQVKKELGKRKSKCKAGKSKSGKPEELNEQKVSLRK